jgi:chromosome segregation ATPase
MLSRQRILRSAIAPLLGGVIAASSVCCTGDPDAPDIYSYRRRHEERMSAGQEQLDATRQQTRMTAQQNRDLERERQQLLRSITQVQDEIRQAKGKLTASQAGAAERERLQAQARDLQREADDLADATREDSRQIQELQARKEKLAAKVAYLQNDIDRLVKVEGGQ